MNETDAAIDPGEFEEIERVAVELARLGGAEIATALGQMLTVSYKSVGEQESLRDPVSEIDHRVEVMIRARLAESFPDHDVLGEEVSDRGPGHDFLWAIDPIDGTTNFVNGLPLFASSVGVLHRGRPVAGALWCSVSHKLVAGIYHARRGGLLSFEGSPVERFHNPQVRRRLVGYPRGAPAEPLPEDTRKTGSASLECAFVAAGLLRAAYFEAPNVWDVAGGLALVEAAGGAAMERGQSWRRFEGFARDGRDPADWRLPLLIGEPGTLDLLASQSH